MKVVRVVVGILAKRLVKNVLKILMVVIDTPHYQNVTLILQKCVDGDQMKKIEPIKENQDVI
jgi:hypothetical protein